MSSRSSELSLLSIAKRHMATDFTFELVLDPADARKGESVLLEAHALVEEIEASLSEFRVDSVVTRLNDSVLGTWIAYDPFFFEVYELARAYRELSEGCFDPFVKSAAPIGFTDFEIDRASGKVRRLKSEARVSFGAIGKGYALDRVRGEIEREGFSNYRLNCGGSSWVFGGFDVVGQPWEIAWAWDRDADGDLCGHRYRLPGGKPLAIGVSGTLEQGNHFLHAGKAIEVRGRSAFYCGRSAAEADALSTALFVGISTAGEEILTKLDDKLRLPSLAYVDLEGSLIYNQGFQTTFLHEGKIR